MRYTTVIDIRDINDVYKNKNARLLYLHLALAAGYHDDDRDVVTISVRHLAEAVGLTVSATRHALDLLVKTELLDKRDHGWYVRKWFADTPPTPRPKKSQAAAVKAEGNIGQRYEAELAEWREKIYAAVRQCTREELVQWAEELENGTQRKHHGMYLKPNQQNIAWLKSILSKQ